MDVICNYSHFACSLPGLSSPCPGDLDEAVPSDLSVCNRSSWPEEYDEGRGTKRRVTDGKRASWRFWMFVDFSITQNSKSAALYLKRFLSVLLDILSNAGLWSLFSFTPLVFIGSSYFWMYSHGKIRLPREIKL